MSTGSYFDKALCATNGELIGAMRSELRGVKYDTIVGTGLSGTIFTSRVAAGLGKKFAIVRKADDKSNHSGTEIEGRIGKRWVFADDFVSSGRTLKRVMERMQKIYPGCEFVGIYEYEAPRFSTVEVAAGRWGGWIKNIALGPAYGPHTRREMEEQYSWGALELKAPVGGWDDRVLQFVPLPSWRYLTLEYPGFNGEIRFYDSVNKITIKASDPRARDLVALVEGYQKAGGTLNRLSGIRMDRFPVSPAVDLRTRKSDVCGCESCNEARNRVTAFRG